MTTTEAPSQEALTINAHVSFDFIDIESDFDVTDAVLLRSAEFVRSLRDYHHSSDELAPRDFLGEGREAFRDEWGEGDDDVCFGYGVAVEESVCTFFGVESVKDVTDELFGIKQAEHGLPPDSWLYNDL